MAKYIMANKFTRFLTGVVNGLTNPKGLVGNYQHATRLFLDNSYRLAPRTKFNFYVRFEVNPTALKSQTFKNRHVEEVGYLIKTTSLPSYNFETETLNQYNRKKIYYSNFSYRPINMTFHDDGAGVINALWALYYGYYIRDRANPEAAFKPNHLSNFKTFNYRYGLDNNISDTPFFRSITIYTMARRRFLSYQLVNPKITSWNHGDGDYSDGTTPMENQMGLEYESVFYGGGNVSFGNPKGFATLYYDTQPSPLSVAGGGVSNLLGEGGVLDGLESIFGDVSDGTAFSSPGNFLGTAIKTINTYKNFKNLSKESIAGEVVNILNSPAAINGVVNTVGGIVGAAFPKNSNPGDTTQATRRNIIGGR